MIDLKEAIKIDPEKVCKKLESFILKKESQLSHEGVILGLSGGLDSAVVASLCVRAIGKKKVVALLMPEKDTEPRSIKDAKMMARKLGIELRVEKITPYLKRLGIYKLLPGGFLPRFLKRGAVRRFYQAYAKKVGEPAFASGLAGLKGKKYTWWLSRSNAYYRIKHRLRMVLLYLAAELENRLVVGAANKTEVMVGFFVKHGCDDAADIMPLASLYKTQVRELARFLEIPKEIIEKAPSPDIIPGITDEFAMGIDYEKLDLILLGLERHFPREEVCWGADTDFKTVDYVKKLIERSEHMRKVYTP